MSKFEDGRDGDTFSIIETGIVGAPTTSPSTNSLNNLLGNGDIVPKEVGEEIKIFTDNPVHWKIGDMILFNQDQEINSAQGFNEHDVRATVTSVPGGAMPLTGPYILAIQSIDRNAIDAEEKAWSVRLEQKPPMFEFKFARFAYRYKYEDGEYSTYSPFSEPAFLPGEYDYLPKKGFNLGMTNRLRQLKITDYITETSERPQDIVEIDLLFKDETSPNIYVIETIRMTDGWSVKGEKLWPDTLNGPNTGAVDALSRGEYEVTSELISSTLPSNQLLRSWDNVPRKALAQSISANRLVYGNYVQNFDLTDGQGCETMGGKEIKPIINVSLKSFDTPLNAPEGTSKDPLNGEDTGEGFPIPRKTVRSLRTYQVGVVYGDEYGRETPVLAGEGGSGSIKVDIKNSSTLNKLRVDIATPSPDWAYYYKFFIKETSNEYYNMAMDRYYDAEDGNIWLSFASADRNKVDLETFIILKKKQDSQEAVTDNARYKILAIENSAPDFIKTNIKTIGQLQDDVDKNHIGTSGNGFPMPDFDQFWCADIISGIDEMFNTSGGTSFNNANDRLIDAVNKGELYVRARTQTIRSEWYQISHYVHQGGYLKFKSDKAFGEDMAFTSANTDYSSRISGLRIELARFAVENKKEFEGRFFVKIYKDLVLIQNLLRSEDIDYRVRSASPIHYFNMPWGRSEKINSTDAGTGADKKYVSWERCGINLEGDMASLNPNTDKNHLFGNNVFGAGTNDKELFFRPANGSYKDGTTTTLCAFQKGVEKWCESSTGRFFFDAKWVRADRCANMHYASGFETCRSDGDSPYENEGKILSGTDNITGIGQTRGLGIHDEAGPNMSMDIGYISPSPRAYVYGTQEDETFINLLMTVGTTFRFREDPDGIVYRVIGSDGTTGTQGGDGDYSGTNYWNRRYGLHHNYDEDTDDNDPGNNVWRWRIDVEVNDLPGIGIGKGPSGYHPLGPKSTTDVSGKAELGWWGGRHGGQHWNSNNAWGDDEFGDGDNTSSPPLRVPAPMGYSSSFLIGDGTVYNNLDTGESVIGRSQVHRWRNHASQFHHIEIVEPMEDEDNDFISDNPAIWETEPKEDADLDIYYEASPALPTKINYRTNEMYAPYGSIVVDGQGMNGNMIPTGVTLTSWSDNQITLSGDIDLGTSTGSRIGFMRPDGLVTYAITNELGVGNVFTIRPNPVCPHPNNNNSDAPHNQPVDLSWYNAWAFGNGVESDRIRDDFNQTMLANGVKASSTIAVQYKEERRQTGLIHSGLYNSTSGLNELNQFIQAEKITKDMNPEYGSIQKLHTRDGDIVVMHEDKIMKVLANKDALYNASGGDNVAVADNFLGSDRPFATKYGISTNPESFATDLYGRIYFTDRARSAVLRLSGDGITNISDYGMRYWFNKYFNPYTNYIIGSYDAKKDLYNVTVDGLIPPVIPDGEVQDDGYNNGCGCINTGSGKRTSVGSGNGDTYRSKDHDGEDRDVEIELPPNLTPFTTTISFSETAKGWVSFKSFIPENAVSINNEYYTFKDGMMYKHHSNAKRNFFYGRQYDSYIDLLFNDQPEIVKNFATLSYEGSQSRITPFKKTPYNDGLYYDLNGKQGWYIEESNTDLQSSGELEFKNKEGKYFTFMKGNTTTLENLDESEFSVQGIGILDRVDWKDRDNDPLIELFCLNIQPKPTCSAVFGCMDATAVNYNPTATDDDGSCDYGISGCMDPNAINYDCANGNNPYDASGNFIGCNDGVTFDDGSCAAKPGCMDPTATNYNSGADIDDNSCLYGCISGVYTESAPSDPDPGECKTSITPITSAGADDGEAIFEMNFYPDAWNNVNAEFEVHDQAGVGNVTLYWDDTPYPGPGQYNTSSVTCSLSYGLGFTQIQTDIITNHTYQTIHSIPTFGNRTLTPGFDTYLWVKFELPVGYWRVVITDPNGCKFEHDFEMFDPGPISFDSSCGLDGTVVKDFSVNDTGNTPGWEDAVTINNPFSYNAAGTLANSQAVPHLADAYNYYRLSDNGFDPLYISPITIADTLPTLDKFHRIPGELFATWHAYFGQGSAQQFTDALTDQYVKYRPIPGATTLGWQSVKSWSFIINYGNSYSKVFIDAVETMVKDPAFASNGGTVTVLNGGSFDASDFGASGNWTNVTSYYTAASSYWPLTYQSSGGTIFKTLNTGSSVVDIHLGNTWAQVLSNLNLMSATMVKYSAGNVATTANYNFWMSGLYEPWSLHSNIGGTYLDDNAINAGNDLNNSGTNYDFIVKTYSNALDIDVDNPWAIRLYLYNHFNVYGGGKTSAIEVNATYVNPFICKYSNCLSL